MRVLTGTGMVDDGIVGTGVCSQEGVCSQGGDPEASTVLSLTRVGIMELSILKATFRLQPRSKNVYPA